MPKLAAQSYQAAGVVITYANQISMKKGSYNQTNTILDLK